MKRSVTKTQRKLSNRHLRALTVGLTHARVTGEGHLEEGLSVSG